MLDKLVFNNQIITNKKRIRKARTQIINKLVQKIRKLKSLNVRKPNTAKIVHNLERIPQIMASVKKIKIVDIIRKILILNKKPAAILTNGYASPDDVAVALLASNKILDGIATTLRTLLHLDDSNPGWKAEIVEMSKRKKKLLESGERKKNRQMGKVVKKPMMKKNPWREENLVNMVSEKLGVNDEVDLGANGWKVEPIADAVKELATLIKPQQVLKKKTDLQDVINEILSKELHEKIEENSPQKPVTTVDSFFFTGTGDNYMSTAVIDRVQPEAPDDGLIRRERRDNAIRPYKRNNNDRRHSVHNSWSNNDKTQSEQNARIDKRHSFASTTKVKLPVIEEKLHPSWIAKQKLKPTISEFKGQKITFGEDGEENAFKSLGKNTRKTSYQHITFDEVLSQDNIHPSWAAKLKQKPAIAEFKGKKITFDD